MVHSNSESELWFPVGSIPLEDPTPSTAPTRRRIGPVHVTILSDAEEPERGSIYPRLVIHALPISHPQCSYDGVIRSKFAVAYLHGDGRSE